jgi:hypothetical protein
MTMRNSRRQRLVLSGIAAWPPKDALRQTVKSSLASGRERQLVAALRRSPPAHERRVFAAFETFADGPISARIVNR